MLSIRPRVFNISTDSSSLNIFLIFNFNLLQVKERTSVFSKMFDILGYSDFLYLPQIMQYSFFIFLVTENIFVFFYHSSYIY